MEQVSEFLNYRYASEVLMVVGMVLALMSILRVMKSSLTLIFWFVLAILGSGTFMYGFKNSDYDALAGIKEVTMTSIGSLGKDTPVEVLQALCVKLEAMGIDIKR